MATIPAQPIAPQDPAPRGKRHHVRKVLVKTTKLLLKAGAAMAAARARAALDAALVKAGRAAAKRQGRRARKAALKTAAGIALVAGGAAVAAAAMRATKRQRRASA